MRVTRFIPLFFVIALLPGPVFAKRAAPAKVEPVVFQGVRYTAPNDEGRRAYIEAWDVQTDKKLWDLTIFTNRIDPKMEEDVQCIYIKTLKIRSEHLDVTSETGKTYHVDLKTRAVTQSERANKSLQATWDGGFSSASRFTLVRPACLSSGR